MVEAVFRFLIAVLLIALCVYVVIWVLGIVGIVAPATVINILIGIAIIVALLYLYRLLRPHLPTSL